MLGLMNNSFDYRENEIEIKKIHRKLETEKDELEIEMLNLELDKKMWTRRNTTYEGKHRIREITAWSKIKKELDNGSFSTNNVEEHQLESYQKMLSPSPMLLRKGTYLIYTHNFKRLLEY